MADPQTTPIYSGHLDPGARNNDDAEAGFWAARGANIAESFAESTTEEFGLAGQIQQADVGTKGAIVPSASAEQETEPEAPALVSSLNFRDKAQRGKFDTGPALGVERPAPPLYQYEHVAPTTPEVPIEDAKAQVKAAKLDKAITLPSAPTIHQGALDIMIQDAQERAARQETIEAGPKGFIPSVLDGATSMFVGAVDPLNAAAFSVPVLGEARYGYLLEKAGQSVLARASVRAAVGGGQGLLGSTLLTPIDWASKTGEGRDYTFTDALSNMIQNAGAGALFHAGPAAAMETYLRVRGRPLPAHIPPGGETPATAPEETALPGEPGRPQPPRATPPAAGAEPGAQAPRGAIATGIPMVDDVLEEPSVRAAIETPQIDREHDVPYGAGSAQEGPGKTYVDRHVPAEAEIGGVTFDPAIPVNIHEQAERFAMESGLPYQQAHEEIATPAEKAWVEANIGPNAWEPYTRMWDGWLSHIEHENAANPPPDLYTKPYPHDQRLALETKGQRPEDVVAQAPEPPVARETTPPPSPMAQAFDALPDRAKEDMARIANADLIAGRPVQGAEVLRAAAASDPRIAQALAAFDRDPSAQAVLRDVRDKLIATGMDPEEATENATIWAARYGARANRLGSGDAMALYQKEGVAIGEGASALEGRSFGQRLRRPNKELPGQMSFFGTEPISDVELAQRHADAPLQASKDQKAMDFGLFSDTETKQPDLLDLAKSGRSFNQPLTAPTFHSAVERAVTNSKLTKGSPEQWLATVKNTPGVKPEEMKWLGLEDWLKEQSGPVTKDQVAQYVNDNNIQVNEVAKGGPAQRGPSSAEDRLALAKQLAERDGLNWNDMSWADKDRYRVEAQRQDDGNPTKFGSYTLPGGENYRELLLTLPYSTAPTDAIGARLGEINERLAQTGGARLPAEEEAALRAEGNRLISQMRSTPSPVYQSSHWDEPNVLAHIRFDDRAVDGQKALHIAEVQSDWHQEGRRKGYLGEYKGRSTEEIGRDMNQDLEELERREPNAEPSHALWQRHPDLLERHERLQLEYDKAMGGEGEYGAVPDAPFKTSWPELSMKRMIRYAAENGYDRITWDTGATNAERYDLSKQISRLELTKSGTSGFSRRDQIEGNTYGTLTAYGHDGHRVIDNKYVHDLEKELPDLIGKEMAERLLNQEPSDTNRAGLAGTIRKLEGLDLKVGGEGMHGFYDKILPTAVNKLVKKFGGKVEEAKVSSLDNTLEVRQRPDGTWGLFDPEDEDINVPQDVQIQGHFSSQREASDWLAGQSNKREIPAHSLTITPAMKEAALSEGFPLFQSGTADPALRGRITLEDNRAIINLFEKADASTFMHESAHLWLDELARDAASQGVPQALKEDFGTILRWLGADRAEDISVEQHEKFAQGFEQYLASGRAPSTALERAFSAFKDWLTAIYRDLRGLGTPISDDVRGVFDRMLTPEEHERIEQASPPPRPARRGNPSNLTTQPQTLIGFIKGLGGLKDHPELQGRDYRASYPGLINNRRGMNLDRAREAAAEAGYLGGDIEHAMSETTVPDFLNALENHPTYSVRDEGRVAEWRQRQEFAEYRRSVEKEKVNIAEFLHRHELPLMSDEAMAEAADLLISGEETSYDNAIERAEIMLYNRDVEREAQLSAAESGNAAPANGQNPRVQPATAGGPGDRSGQTGVAPGARQAIPDPRQARREAEWRAIAERSHPAAGGDIGDGGLGEEAAGAASATPASIDTPERQMSALDKSLSEAEEQWKALEPYLDEDERERVAKALEIAGADEQGRADALMDLLNCMIVAEE